jgi:hypothetical protein
MFMLIFVEERNTKTKQYGNYNKISNRNLLKIN